ncbi:MAG: hypothetical protein AAGF32_06470, partial [Pseudomonadota bacterium]
MFTVERLAWQALRWLVLGVSRTLPARRRFALAPLMKVARQRLRFAKLPPAETFWTSAVLPG